MKKEILGRNSINNEKYKINIAKKYNFYFQKRKKEIIILIILSLNIFFPKFILNKKIENIRQLNLPWEISLKIKGTGQQNILSDQANNGKSFVNAPSEILVNGNIQTPTGYKVDLTEEINYITIKWYNSFSNCNLMFFNLENILEIDLSNFDSSQVTCMLKMFQGCTSLTSINFNNFKTNSVNDMRDVFVECSSLESLDVSGFDTSSVTLMSNLFYGCSSLTSLNLNNFDTSKVTDMKKMFYECKSLVSLDLTNFKTSLVKDMQSMFKDCFLLQSLKINNFDTSSVTIMDRMFYNCKVLESLDISNFETSLVTDMDLMFCNCKLITSLDLNKFETSLVKTMSSMFSGCSSLKSLDLNNFITSSVENMNKMFHGCKSLISLKVDNFDTSKVTDMYSMFGNCSSLISLNLSNFRTTRAKNYTDILTGCSNDLIFCLNATKLSKIVSQITITNPNYINDCSNIIFKNIQNMIDMINNNESTDSTIEEKINCTLVDFFNNNCKIIENEDIIINYIRKEILKDSYSSLIYNIFNEKKDYLVEEKNAKYQLTSSYNQNNKEYMNISTIKLGECETKLKGYDGTNNDSNNPLLIFKVDYLNESHIPIVEYEIYDYNKKKKLNLSICQDIPIEIEIPVSINEKELFKYNISSDYYNDKCFPYTTEEGTDIILNDRKNEYYQKNMSLCEKDCKYNGYNSENKKAKCECKIKENFLLSSESEFDKHKLVEMLELKNSINIYVIKCFHLFLSKDGFIKNIGSYVLLIIIFTNIVLLTLFLVKEYKILNDKIYKIVEIKCQNKKNNNFNKMRKSYKKITKKKSNNSVIIHKITKKINNPPRKKREKNINININNNKTNDFLNWKTNRSLKSKFNNNLINFEKNNNNNISSNDLKYNDYEINNLNYKDALIEDKRAYIEYYISQLKRKHIIIFTFYTRDDYNSFIIKVSLLLYNFAVYYFVNALFCTDLTMHEIYREKGKYNFIYQLPNILYSTVITGVNNFIITYLSLSEKNILKIKKSNENNYDNLIIFTSKIKKCLIIKFILYFLLNFLFLILYWYYLGCFCAVYQNTQIHLIKDTLLSFLLSLLYPFGRSLLPGVLRIPSLNSEKKDKECMYKISKLIQFM